MPIHQDKASPIILRLYQTLLPPHHQAFHTTVDIDRLPSLPSIKYDHPRPPTQQMEMWANFLLTWVPINAPPCDESQSSALSTHSPNCDPPQHPPTKHPPILGLPHRQCHLSGLLIILPVPKRIQQAARFF